MRLYLFHNNCNCSDLKLSTIISISRQLHVFRASCTKYMHLPERGNMFYYMHCFFRINFDSRLNCACFEPTAIISSYLRRFRAFMKTRKAIVKSNGTENHMWQVWSLWKKELFTEIITGKCQCPRLFYSIRIDRSTSTHEQDKKKSRLNNMLYSTELFCSSQLIAMYTVCALKSYH